MNILRSRLREFKLSGIYNNLEERIAYAKDKTLSYTEFLSILLEDEYNNRQDNSYKKDMPRLGFLHIRRMKILILVFSHL